MTYVVYVLDKTLDCFVKRHSTGTKNSLIAFILGEAIDAPMVVKTFASYQSIPKYVDMEDSRSLLWES